MNPRKKAREVALQILFQKPFSPSSSADDLFGAFSSSFDLDSSVSQRALFLTQGVENEIDGINQLLEKYSQNWRVDRMAYTDRIILQIAIFELCFDSNDDTPAKMCISDHIDIAKKYSSKDSKNFINGILDEILHQHLGAEDL